MIFSAALALYRYLFFSFDHFTGVNAKGFYLFLYSIALRTLFHFDLFNLLFLFSQQGHYHFNLFTTVLV